MDITQWLQNLELEQYTEIFKNNDIDEQVLLHLTADNLKDIGITSLGHRMQILEAVSKLKPQDADNFQKTQGSKALAGAIIGFVVGYILSFAGCSVASGADLSISDNLYTVLFFSLFGGGLFAVIGAILGAAFGKSD